MKNALLLLVFLTAPFFLFSQSEKGAEKTIRKFAKYLTNGNYDKVSDMVILDLQNQFLYGYSSNRFLKEFFVLEIFDCKTVVSGNNADCECVSSLSGNRSILVSSLTLIDGKWYVYDLDFQKPFTSSAVLSDEDIRWYFGTSATPRQALSEFAALNKSKKYAEAAEMAILHGRETYEAQVKMNPNNLPVEITDITCQLQRRSSTLNCSCNQISEAGDTTFNHYSLTLINNKWKILEFQAYSSAEYVVQEFVQYLAAGNCEEAQQLTTAEATEFVQGNMDAGCASYKTEIVSVNCEVTGNIADCICKEKRDGLEMTYNYDLQLISGKWLISNYQKDFNLDATSEGEATIEETPPPVEAESIIYEAVDSPAEFPGGAESLTEFIREELRYPDTARKGGVEGTVVVKFVVEKNGGISNISIEKGIQKAMDSEAIRIVESMPAWKAAMLNDRPARSWVKVNITFKI